MDTGSRSRSFWTALPLLAVLAVGFCSTVGQAGEYYSWIDASGNMVLTDDPGQIPEPGSRSAVAVHRYQALPQAQSDLSVPRGHAEVHHETARGTPHEPSPPAPDSSRENEVVPDVLLEAPETPLRGRYNWIPLVAPIYVGAVPVYGFWCHRRVQSPVEAFTEYLRHHQELVPVVTLPAAGFHWHTRPPQFVHRSESYRYGGGNPDRARPRGSRQRVPRP